MSTIISILILPAPWCLSKFSREVFFPICNRLIWNTDFPWLQSQIIKHKTLNLNHSFFNNPKPFFIPENYLHRNFSQKFLGPTNGKVQTGFKIGTNPLYSLWGITTPQSLGVKVWFVIVFPLRLFRMIYIFEIFWVFVWWFLWLFSNDPCDSDIILKSHPFLWFFRKIHNFLIISDYITESTPK